MFIPQVIQTKITPPSLPKRAVYRPRVMQALQDVHHFRLTVIQASAGFGKSTSLAYLARENRPVIWYQVTEDDSDIFVFLLHLFHATQFALPHLEKLPIPLLEGWDNVQNRIPMVEVIHQYLNALSNGLSETTLLILDDIHSIFESVEIAQALDRLVSLAPANLKILLSSRLPVKLPNLPRWQSHGDVLAIDQNLLKFTRAEIRQLFTEQYQHPLRDSEVASLFQLTEGWAIALQLAWQSLRSGVVASVDDLVNRQSESLGSLFEVLTHEVLNQQPADIQEFLRITATLRVMTPAACDNLRKSDDSRIIMDALRRHELFIAEVGQDGLRYHPIFHRFLRQQTSPKDSRGWHSRAASFYRENGDLDAAIYHIFLADQQHLAAELLIEYGAKLLAMGRLDTLAAYLDNLSPEILHQHPALLTYLGDLARLHSRFQEALGWYQQSEALCMERGQTEGLGRALRGQARVYLDTVSPSRAEELLQKALRLSDGTADREAQSRLYQLLAENKLNAGKVEQAERLRLQADALRREGPADSQLEIRVLLRTGQLAAAQQRLEELAESERQDPVHTPRAHRETQLLLSLIYAMRGEPDAAYQAALIGTQRGEDLNSPFVTAVGCMRQGHALFMLPDAQRFRNARKKFEQAVEISRSLAIPRLRVEAYWGLCRTYGQQGDLPEAFKIAEAGIELANLAGDEWNASLVRMTMGANLTLAEEYNAAADWLGQAVRGFRECSDPFGTNVARLWLCLGWQRMGDFERLSQTFPNVLSICRQHGYDFVFTRPTLFGVPNERVLVPLLILARTQGWEGTYPAKLLQEIGLPHIEYHPGYQLKFYTLGSFQAWRGTQEIPHSGWRREKTRQLCQLMITHRHTPLTREQLCEHLWPGVEPSISQRNFKVALSTLYGVLEPERTAGSESAYILRKGTTYSLRPGADIWMDVDEFVESVREAETLFEQDPARAASRMQSALDLYQGEYLPDSRYETWSAAEREHLAVLYLQTADQYCEINLKNQQAEDVIHLCQRILGYDNCWERAYRHLMLAYNQLGDHGQIARTYQRCVEILHSELDVSPAQETEDLYQQLTAN